jgi:hypothetical protein
MDPLNGKEPPTESTVSPYDLLLEGLKLLPTLAWLDFKAKIEERVSGKGYDEALLKERFDKLFSSWCKDEFIPQLKAHLTEVDPLLNQIFAAGADPTRAINEHWDDITAAVESMRTKGAVPGKLSAEDLVSNLLLQPTLKPLPPEHPLLRILGVKDEGEWNRLPADQKITKLFSMWNDKESRNAFGRRAAKHIDSSAQDASRVSVSREQLSPLPEEKKDDGSTRFIRELEAKDELDRLVEKVHFSPTERLVLAGLRRGFKGTGLEDYVLQQPEGNSLKRKSIPVLANRVRSKLR